MYLYCNILIGLLTHEAYIITDDESFKRPRAAARIVVVRITISNRPFRRASKQLSEKNQP